MADFWGERKGGVKFFYGVDIICKKRFISLRL